MKTHGGKREDSGRKLKYEEPTKMVTFRVPVSKEKEFRQLGNEILKQYKPPK